jgi:hypothetical protein
MGEVLHAIDVEAPGLDFQNVPALRCPQACRPESLAEPGEMRSQALGSTGRGLSVVEIVDQKIGWNDLSTAKKQNREEALLLRAKGDPTTLVVDLEWTEKAELHRVRRNRL